MPLSMCHFHVDENPRGVARPDGSYAYSCDRVDGHPGGGPWSWIEVPAPPGVDGFGGLAAELGLDVELPAAVASYGGDWVEYGLVERAYALARPDDFARLLAQYGHRSDDKERRYTISMFLAGCLGRLAKRGDVAYHDGPATGSWSYLPRVSWWAPGTQPPDWSDVRSCAAEGVDLSYVRAATG